MKNNYIIQAWLVLMLAFIFGGSLAGIEWTLGPLIQENKTNAMRQQIPKLIPGQLTQITPCLVQETRTARHKTYPVFQAFTDKKLVGWVVKAKGQGYAGEIELLLGLDPQVKTIEGIYVLEQKETPGLGSKITAKTWRNQFSGKSTAQALQVIKSGKSRPNSIDTITGATISSRSICRIINKTIMDLKAPLNQLTIQ